MRSSLMILSIISIAVSGCGKDVSHTAGPMPPPMVKKAGTGIQVQEMPTQTGAGQCADPIQTNFKPIQNFSDIEMAIGSYNLLSFQAVGIANQPAGSAVAGTFGISVVKGAVKAQGVLEYTEVCRDLNAMPQGNFAWQAIAPSSIDARSGSIAEEVAYAQTVYGPAIMDENGPRQPEKILARQAAQMCQSALSSAAGCALSTYYQIDATTIGVLTTTRTSENGMAVESKIFARYALNGGPAPESPPPTPHHPKPPKNRGGQGNEGKGGQGNEGKGGQGNEGKGGQGNEGKGGQGNEGKGGQGNEGKGGQGNEGKGGQGNEGKGGQGNEGKGGQGNEGKGGQGNEGKGGQGNEGKGGQGGTVNPPQPLPPTPKPVPNPNPVRTKPEAKHHKHHKHHQPKLPPTPPGKGGQGDDGNGGQGKGGQGGQGGVVNPPMPTPPTEPTPPTLWETG